MIIGSLAISANKRNTSKDKRTVPLSSETVIEMILSSDGGMITAYPVKWPLKIQ
jgi:hypothetical protein